MFDFVDADVAPAPAFDLLGCGLGLFEGLVSKDPLLADHGPSLPFGFPRRDPPGDEVVRVRLLEGIRLEAFPFVAVQVFADGHGSAP